MSDESVKVAVRVRPFNQREKDRNAKLTLEINGKMTTIINPENTNEKKSFTFDYSYWSHDDFKEDKGGVLIPNGASSKYASQQLVFDDLGQTVLKNAFDGYNCSLFAYGQTGSGKSFSMVGYGPNKGIVPVVCEELFKMIKTRSDSKLRFEVSFSMLEIYNENVRDLLCKEAQGKSGLSVRQSPLQGFYVQGLKKIPVGSYTEIESRMEQGTSNRTVAMTNMNATSSRAHTVVTITFDQLMQVGGADTKKSSIMNLVDLAGSERADSTGAVGDRLKEGANINRSLSVLGNVISALADISNGKKKVMVPYRDSVLTKLLQNALGGNSKTVMIAALSPADINYDETLGTLRYADRAKQIKNKAVVNENPVEKLMRELREENEKLKQALSTGNLPQMMNTQGLSNDEVSKMRQEIMDELKAQLKENTEIIKTEDPKNWDAKLEEARKEAEQITRQEKSEGVKRKSVPHLINLNEDPQLSGVIVHYLTGHKILVTRQDEPSGEDDEDDEDSDSDDNTTVKKTYKTSNGDSKKKQQQLQRGHDHQADQRITLKGLSISNKHAFLERRAKSTDFVLKPALFGAKIKVNGAMVTADVFIRHKDRILFGSNHMYLFMDPHKRNSGSEDLPKLIDWEFAQAEIAQADGFETENVKGLTKDQQVVQQQILEIIPMVGEVNAISEELGKFKKFFVILVPPNSQDAVYGTVRRTVIMIKVSDTKTGNFWLWERGKFMNRRFLMQELYHKYLETTNSKGKQTGVQKQIRKEDDPFWEPVEEVLVGTANAFLQALAYNLDFDDEIPIISYDGEEEGLIRVAIYPCSANGRALEGDVNFVENPKALLTRTFHFLIQIAQVELSNPRYKLGIRVRYRVFKDDKLTETELIRDTCNPKFNHNKVISFARISEDHIDYFEHNFITFRVYVQQRDSMPVHTFPQTLTVGSFSENNHRRLSVLVNSDPSGEATKYKSEIALLNKRLSRLERKDRCLKSLCSQWKSLTNPKYEDFFNAVWALSYGSEAAKFRTDSRIVGQLMLYSTFVSKQQDQQQQKPASSDQANGATLSSSSSNPCLRDRNSSMDRSAAARRGASARSDDVSSKACSIM